ncbi:hydroxyacylglutathione hydrolase [Entophlyctis helioformis]|nr:hydroxyacylglutathione hydrolase [Entophlyctis helioformis]
MLIHPVPVLQDNYAYVLVCPQTQTAAVIDPAEPAVVTKALRQLVSQATIPTLAAVKSILTTHHHGDHAGGNMGMLKELPGLDVYGADERVPGLTHTLAHGDVFHVGSIKVTALLTPCHTRGSVSFLCEAPAVGSASGGSEDRAVFTGDTLFVGGCGRFFEGTASQMHESLNTILASLPPTTAVYCGHEYTVANLRFAASIEPSNTRIADKLAWAQSVGQTVPSTIADELETNPFMRVGHRSVQEAVGVAGDAIAAMDALRTRKNNFR